MVERWAQEARRYSAGTPTKGATTTIEALYLNSTLQVASQNKKTGPECPFAQDQEIRKSEHEHEACPAAIFLPAFSKNVPNGVRRVSSGTSEPFTIPGLIERYVTS